MKSVKRLYNLVRVLLVMARLKIWSETCKDPVKQQICKILYRTACFTYNHIKYGWMPEVE